MHTAFALIGQSWDFAKKQPALHGVGLWLTFMPLVIINILTRIGQSFEARETTSADTNLIVAAVLLMIVLSVLTTWGSACTLLVGKRQLQGSAGRNRSSFRAVRHQSAGFILPLIITGIIRSGMIFLLTLLLIIPGIIYSVYTAFYAVIIVCEGTSYRASLRRSTELVRGRTLQVLLTLLILALTLFAPVEVMSIIGGMLARDNLALGITADIVTTAFQSLSLIVFTLALVRYYGLLLKESPDNEG